MSTITTTIDPFTKSPSRQNPATFSADMDTRLAEENSRIVQMNAVSTEMNTVSGEVNTNAIQVAADTLTTAGYKDQAAISAAEAAISAASAAISENLAASSEANAKISEDNAKTSEVGAIAAQLECQSIADFPSMNTSGAGGGSIFVSNASIAEDVTITAPTNGMSIGPLTIQDPFTVTVEGTWTII